MWLRRLLMLLLVLLFSLPLFSQESNPTELDFSHNLWSNIDLTLNLLEEQTNDMQTLIDKQKQQIQNLENAYQNTYLLYINSENKYKQLEQDMNECKQSLKIWKTVAITTSITTVLAIVAIGVINVR